MTTVMDEQLTVDEVLARAIEIKRERPHARFTFFVTDPGDGGRDAYGNEAGGVCFIGSLLMAMGANFDDGDELIDTPLLDAVVERLGYDNYGDLCGVNNDSDKETVIARMEQALAG